MDCAQFEVLLFAGLDAPLEPAEREQMALHEQGCARCQRLAEVVRGSFDPAASEPAQSEPADELAATVLESTSGKACEQAATLLADAFDAGVDVTAGSGELLALHIASCPDCAALESTLAQLRRELPALAEADPGAAFVGSVLAATSLRARRRAVPRIDLAGLWDRLANRPRLALEGSYVITMLALLVFGMPSWSASESSVQSFENWWRERADAARELIEGASDTARDGLRSLSNANDSENVDSGNTDSAN